jgi:hypothetical protein
MGVVVVDAVDARLFLFSSNKASAFFLAVVFSFDAFLNCSNTTGPGYGQISLT